MTESSDPSPKPSSPPLPNWVPVVVALVLHAGILALLLDRILLSSLIGYDGFWHVLTGHIIADTGGVPTEDPWCFTTQGYEWINLNWLAQVISWWSFSALGWAGPLALSSILVVGALIAVWASLRERNVHPVLALAALGVAGWALWIPYGIRPRMWSFALLAVCAWLLVPKDERVGQLSWQRVAGLLVVLLVWNNLHGGFVYGYGLVGCALVGAALDSRLAGGPLVTSRWKRLAGVIGVGLLGFVLHPHGFAALHYALTYPLRFQPEYFVHTYELQPFDFRGGMGPVLEVYLLVAVSGVVFARRKVRLADLLPILVFLHLTLTVRRGITPFLLISAPFVAELWSAILRERVSRLAQPMDILERALRPALKVLPAVLGVAILVWCLAVVPGRTSAGELGEIDSPALSAERHPLAVARYLQQHPEHDGRIFNAFGSGGCLAWALYPQRRVFIDGRGDFHSQGDALPAYLQIIDLQPGWEEQLEAQDIDLVVMPLDSPLTHALLQRGWRLLFGGDGFALLGKNVP